MSEMIYFGRCEACESNCVQCWEGGCSACQPEVQNREWSDEILRRQESALSDEIFRAVITGLVLLVLGVAGRVAWLALGFGGEL